MSSASLPRAPLPPFLAARDSLSAASAASSRSPPASSASTCSTTTTSSRSLARLLCDHLAERTRPARRARHRGRRLPARLRAGLRGAIALLARHLRTRLRCDLRRLRDGHSRRLGRRLHRSPPPAGRARPARARARDALDITQARTTAGGAGTRAGCCSVGATASIAGGIVAPARPRLRAPRT